jgi:hypothetical protein
MNLDFIISILISALKTAGKAPALAFLQSIHDKDADLYKVIVVVGNYGLKKGAEAAAKTKTLLDDETAAALLEILTESATANGVTL